MRTVKQVAATSGLSVRALHHYDHIGLLKPEIGDNGYRYYGEIELLRLQHILFYRELGMPLSEIAHILDDPAYDIRAALFDLRCRVQAQITKHRDLAETIDRTLAMLDAGQPLQERHMFYGVTAEKQIEWEVELAAQYGDPAQEAIDLARVAIEAQPPAGLLEFKAEIDTIHTAFVSLIEAGCTPGSTPAQVLIARHYRWVCRSWRPDAVAYTSLGKLYQHHTDFHSMYDALHPRMAQFLGDAMATYAHNNFRLPRS